MKAPEIDYRTLLKEAWESKRKKNPAYSLRAFSRDIGLSVSKLSLVLRGEARLGVDHAFQIAPRLGLDEETQEAFRLSAVIEVTRNPDLQAEYVNRLASLQGQSESVQLSLDIFRAIADWYHIPLLLLLSQSREDQSSRALAKRLGITTTEVDCAIDRLMRLNLIERDEEVGRYRRSTQFNQIYSPRRNEALRRFHREMGEKALTAVSERETHERVVGSETFTLRPEHLKEIEARIMNFKKEISQLVDQLSDLPSNEDHEIYHLQIICFPITERKSK